MMLDVVKAGLVTAKPERTFAGRAVEITRCGSRTRVGRWDYASTERIS
jgi:hypothetical protein